MVPEARRITTLPPDIEILQDKSAAEGHGLVTRLVEEWRDGTNRFDRPGEALVEVRSDSALFAVGGLNIDPYLEDPRVGRIRHVFVDPDHRRRGAGRLLIVTLIGIASESFERIRLRSVREGGPEFYESLGFVRATEPEATHELRLQRHTPAP